jgi:hypothetical protein
VNLPDGRVAKKRDKILSVFGFFRWSRQIEAEIGTMTEILRWKIVPIFVGMVLLFSAAALQADGWNSSGQAGLLSSVYTSNNAPGNFSELRFASGKGRSSFAGTDQLFSQGSSFNLGGVQLQLNYQDIGQDFTRFSALRQNLAMTNAEAQLFEKQQGIKRMGIALQLASGTQPAAGVIPNGLYWNNVQDKSGSYWSRGLNFSSKSMGFFADIKGSNAGFQRMKDLTDADKTDMALQIKREFNPDATAAQVTAADKAQMLNQAGFERSSYGLRFGAGETANWLQMLNIKGDGGGIQRNTLRLSGKSFHLTAFKQSIDAGFTKLTSLTTTELQQFGNERGMDRLNINGDAKIGKTINSTMAFSRVSDQNAGLTRESLGLTGKTFSVKANYVDIDPKFTRILDLADTDKYTLLPDLGYRRTDLSASFTGIKGLSLKTFFLGARNESQKLTRGEFRNDIVYTPDANTKLTLLNDQFNYGSDAGADLGSYLHRIIALDHKFGKGLLFSGLQDSTDIKVSPLPTLPVFRQTLHLATDPAKSISMIADRNRVTYFSGKFENTTQMNIRYALGKSLNIAATHLVVDRGADPSVTADTCNLQWTAKSGVALIANMTTQATNNNQDTSSQKIALQSAPIKKLGPLTNLKLSGGISMDQFANGTSGASSLARMDAGVLGGNLNLEYSGRQSSGKSVTSLMGYKFASDRDPKKWMHFDVTYKNRVDALGKPVLVRAYNVDTKLSPNTTVAYSYYTYQEAAAGVLTPVGGSAIHLASKMSNGCSLVIDYKKDNNYLYKTIVSPLTIGLAGKLSHDGSYELNIGRSRSGTALAMVEGNTLTAKYSHQISADHYLNLEAAYTHWNKTVPTLQVNNDLEARIDFQAHIRLTK